MIGLAHRFSFTIEGLCGVVAVRSAADWSMTPVLVLLWTRLRRMAIRFASLAARLDAGPLPVARPSSGPRSPRGPRPNAPRLPGGFAWLIRYLQATAVYASQLRHLLADPAMTELLAAAPQAGRIFRPLCRMLAIEPEALPPPPIRQRVDRPAPPPLSPPAAGGPSAPDPNPTQADFSDP